jgi:hypothetical protein
MPGSERNDDDRSTPRFNHVSADNGIRSVVAAFHQYVRPYDADQLEWCVLGKHDDGVDGLERGQYVRALRGRPHRSGRTLEATDRLIIVYADEKCRSQRTRGDQHVHVSGVEQVEDAVCEYEVSAEPGSPPRGGAQRQDLFGR